MTNQEIAVEIVKLATKSKFANLTNVSFWQDKYKCKIIEYIFSSILKTQITYNDNTDTIHIMSIYRASWQKPLWIHNATKVIGLFRSMK